MKPLASVVDVLLAALRRGGLMEFSAAAKVMLGGVLVLATGILIGSA